MVQFSTGPGALVLLQYNLRLLPSIVVITHLRPPVVAPDPLPPERLKGERVEDEDEQRDLALRHGLQQPLGPYRGPDVVIWFVRRRVRDPIKRMLCYGCICK
jgi:hypothetical protein